MADSCMGSPRRHVVPSLQAGWLGACLVCIFDPGPVWPLLVVCSVTCSQLECHDGRGYAYRMAVVVWRSVAGYSLQHKTGRSHLMKAQSRHKLCPRSGHQHDPGAHACCSAIGLDRMVAAEDCGLSPSAVYESTIGTRLTSPVLTPHDSNHWVAVRGCSVLST